MSQDHGRCPCLHSYLPSNQQLSWWWQLSVCFNFFVGGGSISFLCLFVMCLIRWYLCTYDLAQYGHSYGLATSKMKMQLLTCSTCPKYLPFPLADICPLEIFWWASFVWRCKLCLCWNRLPQIGQGNSISENAIQNVQWTYLSKNHFCYKTLMLCLAVRNYVFEPCGHITFTHFCGTQIVYCSLPSETSWSTFSTTCS